MAQQVIDGEPTSSNLTVEVSRLRETFAAQHESLAQKQSELEAEIAALAAERVSSEEGLATPPGGEAATGSDPTQPGTGESVIRLNIDYPQLPAVTDSKQKHEKLGDHQASPMLNGLRAGATEHWRNFRDHFPR